MKLGPKYISAILVGAQMVCIFFLLVRIPLIQSDFWARIVSFIGLTLGFWAIISMKLDNVNVTPDVRHNARLVTTGPYKIIRHPMYSAVLLAFLPFVIDKPSAFLTVIYMVLLITLVVKLNYEETLLRIHFKDYDVYMLKTWRLIPFIY